jgi:hypothetical protein
LKLLTVLTALQVSRRIQRFCRRRFVDGLEVLEGVEVLDGLESLRKEAQRSPSTQRWAVRIKEPKLDIGRDGNTRARRNAEVVDGVEGLGRQEVNLRLWTPAASA